MGAGTPIKAGKNQYVNNLFDLTPPPPPALPIAPAPAPKKPMVLKPKIPNWNNNYV